VTGAVALPGRILSWSEDTTLRLWDSASGAGLATLEGHAKAVTGALALSDQTLLSWSSDNTLRRWDGETGAALTTLVGHTDGVRGAVPLPGRRLLSWSFDGTLCLWDFVTGATLATLVGHTAEVNGAQVLRDGRILSWYGLTTGSVRCAVGGRRGSFFLSVELHLVGRGEHGLERDPSPCP
jgi:WD40 repeat protein